MSHVSCGWVFAKSWQIRTHNYLEYARGLCILDGHCCSKVTWLFWSSRITSHAQVMAQMYKQSHGTLCTHVRLEYARGLCNLDGRCCSKGTWLFWITHVTSHTHESWHRCANRVVADYVHIICAHDSELWQSYGRLHTICYVHMLTWSTHRGYAIWTDAVVAKGRDSLRTSLRSLKQVCV